MMWSVLKYFGLVVAIVLTSPLWLSARAGQMIFRSERPFAGAAQFVSLFPGMVGVYFRRAYYLLTLNTCAWDVHVDFGTFFAHSEVVIGKGVYIGARCILGKCVIGDAVLIGSNVDILSGRRQHHFSDTERPTRDQGGQFTPVHIGRNTWLGNSSVIMADVGENTVVGAGSVVVHAAPPHAVVVGNPAAVKRMIPQSSQPSS
jgi:acetyltransferase-like isoleucine patch superfamily enzyme